MPDDIICSKCGSPNPPDTMFCGKCGTRVVTEKQASQADPLIGAFVGDRFLVHEKLGEGGMGVVYRAEQTAIQREVALKVLHSNLTQDESLYARFQNEAAASSRLNHPNTITIYDFGKTGENSLYIAMEFIKGTSLDDEIRAHGAMDSARACRIAVQICGSLEDAHNHNIIHRDLKPENVMLCERAGEKDVVKVLDFGIAKIMEDDGTDQRKALTKTGMVFGTPQYMSPEQIRGEKVDNRTDIYSLGVILYQMLKGELPFFADTPMGLLTKHLMDVPAPLDGTGVPQELESVVMKTLAKEPEKRPQSMRELADELSQTMGLTGQMPLAGAGASADTARLPQTIPEDAVAKKTARPAAGPAAPKSGAPIGLIIAGIVILLGGGAAAWYFVAGPGAQKPAVATVAAATAVAPQAPTGLSQAGAQIPLAAPPGVQTGVQPQAGVAPAPLPYAQGQPAAPEAPAPEKAGARTPSSTPGRETTQPGQPGAQEPKPADPTKPPRDHGTPDPKPEDPGAKPPESGGPTKDVACKYVGGKARLAKAIKGSIHKKEGILKKCTLKSPVIDAAFTFQIEQNATGLSQVAARAGKSNDCAQKVLASSTFKANTEELKNGVATISLSRTNDVVDKCTVLVKILPKKSKLLEGIGLKRKPK